MGEPGYIDIDDDIKEAIKLFDEYGCDHMLIKYIEGYDNIEDFLKEKSNVQLKEWFVDNIKDIWEDLAIDNDDFKPLKLIIDGKDIMERREQISANYKILYNQGAVERCRMPNEQCSFEGTENDLIEILGELYVDCTNKYWEMDMTLEKWLEYYEENADISGSTVLIEPYKEGAIIYRDPYFSSGINAKVIQYNACDEVNKLKEYP